MLRRATLAGLVVGIAYTLSPLTVWFATGIVPVIWYGARGLDADERRWVTRMLIAAVSLRLLAVAGLFLVTDHSRVAFGTFFGDEEYFIERSLWLRNAALGIPLHGADLASAFDSSNGSSYLYLLALIQILVGRAPYGLHLLGILLYLLAAVLLYRLVRSTLGRMPALLGLTVLLFLPSLFAWSVSALKEPLFVLVSALNLVIAVKLVRASSWRSRALALTALVAFAVVLESVRQSGAVLSVLSVVIGLTIGFVAMRPRLMLATLVATPILVAAVFSRPEIQLKAFVATRSAASQHWAYVTLSPGYGYKTLEEHFYAETSDIPNLRLGEAVRFLVRGLVAYVTVPLPWKAQSRTAAAYLPEQIVWYLLAVLAPVGLLFAFRRDPAVAGLLLGHAIVIAFAVAISSGNVGTLVRHRSLVLPYLVWLSAVGACELISNQRRFAPAPLTLRPPLTAGRAV
jgi:hypothetical protein